MQWSKGVKYEDIFNLEKESQCKFFPAAKYEGKREQSYIIKNVSMHIKNQ